MGSSRLQIIRSRPLSLRSTPSRVVKGSAFGQGLYNDLAAFNLVRIEAVERLAECVDDVVRDVHHIINRAQADDAELVLQPFGAFLYGDAFHGDAGIVRAGFAVLYRHPDVEVVVIDGKSLHRGFLQGGGLAVLHQVGVQGRAPRRSASRHRRGWA